MAVSVLGQTLRAWITHRGLSMRAFSRQAQIPVSTVNALVNGDQQGLGSRYLQQAAQALGVTTDVLLAGQLPDGTQLPAAERSTVPTDGVHPLMAEAVRRFGKYLTDADWAKLAGYLTALAEDERTKRRTMQPPGEEPQVVVDEQTS